MPKIICNRCREPVVKDLEYPAWLSLMNFFSFLYHEEEITQNTYENMQNYLMVLKPWATSEQEDLECLVEDLEKKGVTIEDVIKEIRSIYEL